MISSYYKSSLLKLMYTLKASVSINFDHIKPTNNKYLQPVTLILFSHVIPDCCTCKHLNELCSFTSKITSVFTSTANFSSSNIKHPQLKFFFSEIILLILNIQVSLSSNILTKKGHHILLYQLKFLQHTSPSQAIDLLTSINFLSEIISIIILLILSLVAIFTSISITKPVLYMKIASGLANQNGQRYLLC